MPWSYPAPKAMTRRRTLPCRPAQRDASNHAEPPEASRYCHRRVISADLCGDQCPELADGGELRHFGGAELYAESSLDRQNQLDMRQAVPASNISTPHVRVKLESRILHHRTKDLD